MAAVTFGDILGMSQRDSMYSAGTCPLRKVNRQLVRVHQFIKLSNVYYSTLSYFFIGNLSKASTSKRTRANESKSNPTPKISSSSSCESKTSNPSDHVQSSTSIATSVISQSSTIIEVKPAQQDSIVNNAGCNDGHPNPIDSEQLEASRHASPLLKGEKGSTETRLPLFSARKLPAIYIEDRNSFRSKEEVRRFTDGDQSDVEQPFLFYRSSKSPGLIQKGEAQCTLHSETSLLSDCRSSNQQPPNNASAIFAGKTNHTHHHKYAAGETLQPQGQHVGSSGSSTIAVQTDSEYTAKDELESGEGPSSPMPDPSKRSSRYTANNDYWGYTRNVSRKRSFSLSEPSSTKVNHSMIVSAQSSCSTDALDAILSTNLLKDCYSAVGKTNYHSDDLRLSDSLRKIIEQGELKQSEQDTTNASESRPMLKIRRSSSVPSFETNTQDATNTCSSCSIRHAKSVDLIFGEGSRPSINFNNLTDPLRDAKVLPSQLNNKKLEIRQLLRDQRRRREVSV